MLTVISCSHNGAGHLPKMLDSFCRLRPPRGGWKMVFVDNASTDGTGDLVRSYADRLPLKVVEEPGARRQPGQEPGGGGDGRGRSGGVHRR